MSELALSNKKSLDQIDEKYPQMIKQSSISFESAKQDIEKTKKPMPKRTLSVSSARGDAIASLPSYKPVFTPPYKVSVSNKKSI